MLLSTNHKTNRFLPQFKEHHELSIYPIGLALCEPLRLRKRASQLLDLPRLNRFQGIEP